MRDDKKSAVSGPACHLPVMAGRQLTVELNKYFDLYNR